MNFNSLQYCWSTPCWRPLTQRAMSIKLEFTSSVVFHMCIAYRQQCVLKTLCWLASSQRCALLGGAKLTDGEWKALQATSVDGPQHAHKLSSTEHFFQACYTWSVVSLAYAVRSFEAAKACGRTLYATRAMDVVQNVSQGQAAAAAEALLAHTNMNDTGRLPHFGLYHVAVEVRLTQTLAAPHVVVDCIGLFVALNLRPSLYQQPCLVTESEVCASHGGGLEELTAKVRRTQIPLVTVKASTLHVLQGTTTDPGLIFHWRFPRRLQTDMRWLASYVALSRVRSLERLRSVGLDHRVREILEQGPPDTLPLRFRQLFAEKEAMTRDFAEQCLTTLGW